MRHASRVRSLLAIVFPSGLILSNSRATYEAFFGGKMVFTRTLRAGERYVGGWRGGPELLAGVLLPVFAFSRTGLERTVLRLRGRGPRLHRRHGLQRRLGDRARCRAAGLVANSQRSPFEKPSSFDKLRMKECENGAFPHPELVEG